MAKICMVGLPGKIGRCVNTSPIYWPLPVKPPRGKSEELGLYPEIFVDVAILNAIHHATNSISDTGTRDALGKGIESALAALKKRGGNEVHSITLED